MHLLIPAAGLGKRMGGDRNKLLLTLSQKPLLAWTLQAVEQSEQITWIGLIGQPHDFPAFEQILADLYLTKPVHLIEGGDTRQASVYNGLQALPASAQWVLIHDGARCLATPALFDRCAIALRTCPGLIAAIPVKDTIKIVNATQQVTHTPDRSTLWAAQTPQGFAVATLKACHDRGKSLGWEVTDDAALFEQCDLPVQIVPGEESNLKITTPMDLAIAEFILQHRQS
ncbi:2-C-methyl-D-erythritol 4-phosphate cytidylyltransferase [Spirulina major CS-329]|jgi:2-C-methyl-D-erythritol 4-phosphate cytidylyltransferase|uniref:2-C-methyl-D-erythritol 4-phosphate cytidylyltransferase n=1 Tax=Spirulina TaxID=1154 RepID=UPI00232E0105|nr:MULTISPECIES: 2-C-methyl-D-erythritol 4-phosphate cytidylyltransferase [Spirulina]MDB9493411.1 2-C-methyl-D-erythritol 4-phosphate cytidylyltransferase [Spirulina subsalsa CS-330]MDB9504002.1 2-C-methyl-D-erythritol 4-phosphate cytidylyltransferase [Spirulina major CS-329]